MISISIGLISREPKKFSISFTLMLVRHAVIDFKVT